MLGRMHEMGVKLAIDDFGTGYSSLAYLKRLPVDEIKIDRSFITDIDTTDNDRVIVRPVVDLAHTIGLRLVAEGVEDQAGSNLLAAMHCDPAQG